MSGVDAQYKLYDDEFYRARIAETEHPAQTVLEILWPLLMPQSVVDVGCGAGNWLSAAGALGATRIDGVDGPWVNPSLLQIDRSAFHAYDLESLPDWSRRYDLAMSLEVAEHLSTQAGDRLVSWLTAHGDAILFSAAIPRQGGKGHVNEQWPSYWARKFAQQGFAPVDYIRPRIWTDERIPYWYRQNIILYLRHDSSLLADRGVEPVSDPDLLNLVHPHAWEKKLRKHMRRRDMLRAFRQALRQRLAFR